MRKIILCLIFFPIYLQGDAQVKKYRAKISAMLDDYDGNIHINLFGENKGLVRIDVKRILKEDSSFGVSKTFGVPDKKNSTFNLDAGFVYKVIINKDTFYRKDLLETYEKTDGSNRKKNCFVKRIYGKEDIHLYEWTNANKEIQYYIQFQLSDNNAAKNINHPNYDKWSADMILYGFKK